MTPAIQWVQKHGIRIGGFHARKGIILLLGASMPERTSVGLATFSWVFFLRSKAPSRGLWMPELVLYSIRLLA